MKNITLLLLVVALVFIIGKVIFRLDFLNGEKSMKKDTLLVAHRGLSASYPENSFAAFKAALEFADIIELDVHLTRDNVLVVLHDDTLDRTTDGRGKVEDFTLKEIKDLDAGSWFAEEFAGERVPTLEEVLKFVKGKIKLNIEIKNIEDENLNLKTVEECVRLVKKFDMVEDVIVSSFDHDILSYLKKMAPKFRIYLLFGQENSHLFYDLVRQNKLISYIQKRQAEGVNIGIPLLSSKIVEDLKKVGLKVGVYTINEQNVAQKFLKLGVNLIYSDAPDRLKI